MKTVETLGAAGNFLLENRGLAISAAGTAAFITATEVAAIALRAHGDESHRANGLSKPMKHVLDKAMWFMTTDPVSWSTAHVADGEVNGQVEGYVHHGMTDANLFPSYEIESYLRAIESDPGKYEGFPTLPENELIPNLDPSAQFTYDEVRALGSFSHGLLDSILGEEHQPQTELTLEEAERILDTSKPRFTYGEPTRKPKDEPYTPEEKAEILLRDSYSPALEPLNEKIKNGVYGTYKYNVPRFRAPTDFFRREPQNLPPMYEDRKVDAPDNKLGPAVLFGSTILAFTAFNVARKGLTPTNVTLGIVAGAVAPIGGIYGPIKGGEIVNAGGHAGRLDLKKLFRMFRNKPDELVPNYDGSYMTKIEGKGPITRVAMKIVSLIFVDELEGQPAHHAMPWKRQYSFNDGVRGWIEAPETSFIQSRSEAKRFRFGLRPGEGFKNKYGNRRPDVPNTAITEIVQPARVRTVYPHLYNVTKS